MIICTALLVLIVTLVLLFLLSSSQKTAKIEKWVSDLKNKASAWGESDIIRFDFNGYLTDESFHSLKGRLVDRITQKQSSDSEVNPYGSPVWYINLIADHFLEKFDFHQVNAVLNEFKHFKTEIGDTNLHFIHMQGNEGSVPIILLHGWPSTIWEFHKSIPILLQQGYTVVVPSLPGHGFTEGPTVPGVSPSVIACAYHKLMIKLGYNKYVVHGGDWGAVIGTLMTSFYPMNVIGFHVTMNPLALGWRLISETLIGCVFPSLVYSTEQEKSVMHPLSTFNTRNYKNTAYFHAQSVMPDCYSHGLMDSPAGLIGWIGYVYPRVSGGKENLKKGIDNFGIDNICAMVFLFWATRTAQSSMRIYHDFYWSNDKDIFMNLSIPNTVPVAISNFPFEITHMTKFASKGRYENIKQFTYHDKGGHFANIDNTVGVTGDLISFIQNHVSLSNRI